MVGVILTASSTDVTYCVYSVISPIQAVVILLWYYTWEIVDEDEWYKFTGESLIMVFSQVCTLVAI